MIRRKNNDKKKLALIRNLLLLFTAFCISGLSTAYAHTTEDLRELVDLEIEASYLLTAIMAGGCDGAEAVLDNHLNVWNVDSDDKKRIVTSLQEIQRSYAASPKDKRVDVLDAVLQSKTFVCDRYLSFFEAYPPKPKLLGSNSDPKLLEHRAEIIALFSEMVDARENLRKLIHGEDDLEGSETTTGEAIN